jgi:hypothetical protein
MRKRLRRLPREGVILAGTVLLAAAAATVILALSSLAGGNTAAVSTPTRERFAIEHAQVRVVEWQKARLAWEAARPRRQLVWQIDTWLAQRGSPMAGLGECYVQNQERTGIPATLSVGIAEAESSSGMACYGPHNAWGMIGYPGGWGSWEEGIAANFDYLVRYFGCPQSMSDCPGYCEGDGTMRTVNDVMAAINRLDASGVQ